ncbi:hypothetical protein GCM10010922_08290 [Microbacterium sorbitolivorans]|nr:hypothetical protein GCM10010922_08290 [Microbacterium sorbitolivorans]
MLVDLQAEANLLENRVGLVATCFLGLLCGLVLELSVVHDLGYGRTRVGSNLDEVEVLLLGEAKCNLAADNTDLFAAGTDKTDLRHANALVDAGIADAELLMVR